MNEPATITELTTQVRAFADAREWSQFHDPKNLAMALTSEAGELAALFRWVPNADADIFAGDSANRTRITLELGDVGILLLLLCDRVGVSLAAAVVGKLQLNGAKYPVERSKGRSEPPTE
mgnify:CR=1 FL=1